MRHPSKMVGRMVGMMDPNLEQIGMNPNIMKPVRDPSKMGPYVVEARGLRPAWWSRRPPSATSATPSP
eukprot:5411718-Alexandrium_andersonii.AAC.1